MASPLMSPPHNGTPFIYFTERMSSVISTALKSYYLNVNDEWIDRGCQEQYLFVCPGQPWLFLFNSIPPLPLSVIDNWCDVTLPSEDVEFFFRQKHTRVACYRSVLSGSGGGAFCCPRYHVTGDDLTLMRSTGSGGGAHRKKTPVKSSNMPPNGAARCVAPCPLSLWSGAARDGYVFSNLFFFWKMSKLWGCAADWQPRVSSKSLVQHRGQPR